MEKIPDVKNKLNETNAFFLLEKIIPKDESLYLWCYSSSKELVATTCPQAYKLESLFSLFEMKLSLKEYLNQLDTEKPASESGGAASFRAAQPQSFCSRQQKDSLSRCQE